MLENDADRLEAIKSLDGQLVRLDDREIWAIFDNEYQGSLGDNMIESSGPALTCRTSDVLVIRKGATVGVGELTFKINRHEPDGTGMSVIRLGRP